MADPRSWPHPSHPEVQEVHIGNENEFGSKSFSKVDLPPFAVYAKFEFPPCTETGKATYATVQMGINKHLLLNSDLVYINHSCEPSVIFDTKARVIIAGPKGLKKGEELTFFYPSTEWNMDQPFDCECKKPTCFGSISGAKDIVTLEFINQIQETSRGDLWLNSHIVELLAKHHSLGDSLVVHTPRDADKQALTLRTLLFEAQTNSNESDATSLTPEDSTTITTPDEQQHGNGITSRELSGEMGGDTKDSSS